MKLRLRDNSIRLRLTQSEVHVAGKGDKVVSTVPFGSGVKLEYVLEGSETAAVSVARFQDGVLIVSVPVAQLSKWANSDEVSIATEQQLDDDDPLHILVEKDFACLAPREDEDESDMFPHPLDGQETC